MYIKEKLKERNIEDDPTKTIIIQDNSPQEKIKMQKEKVPKFRIVPKSHLIPNQKIFENKKISENKQNKIAIQLNIRHNRSIDIAPIPSESAIEISKSRGFVEQMMRPKAIEKQLEMVQKTFQNLTTKSAGKEPEFVEKHNMISKLLPLNMRRIRTSALQRFLK